MTIQTIDAHDADRMLRSGTAVLIDVREPAEFAAGHVPQALSMPLGTLPHLLDALALLPETRVIFQCQKGGRGGQACVATADQLVGRAYNLAGGIEAWSAAGLPVTGPAGGVSIFRQVQMVVGLLVVLSVAAGLAGFAPGFYLAGLFGAMLALAGVTGWCGLALLLRQMPWNRNAPA